MARTTTKAVEGVLLVDYRRGQPLSSFMVTAGALVDDLVAYGASLEPGIAVGTDRAELLERWLAAHFYKHTSDRQLQSKNTLQSGGTFTGQTGMGLTGTTYGQTAIVLDPTGYLQALVDGEIGASQTQAIQGAWLGKTRSEMLPYDQRN